MTFTYNKTHKYSHSQPDDNAWWSGANGGDVIQSFVERSDFYEGIPGIELKLERLMQAVGRIADKSGINLLEVFEPHELGDTFRPHQDD